MFQHPLNVWAATEKAIGNRDNKQENVSERINSEKSFEFQKGIKSLFIDTKKGNYVKRGI